MGTANGFDPDLNEPGGTEREQIKGGKKEWGRGGEDTEP